MRGLCYQDLPEHMRGVMQRYIENHLSPGGFLEAVLSNNLTEAVSRADSISINALPVYVRWLYNKAPYKCWGSSEKVIAWLASDCDTDL